MTGASRAEYGVRLLDHCGIEHCLGPRWGVDGPAE
jgi:hypothetical protein